MMRAMDRIRVACAGFRGPRSLYWKQGLDAAELEARAVEARPATLHKWLEGTPEGARYVPMVDARVAEARFAGEAADAGWARTVEVAKALGADTVLLHTRAGLRPTRENRDRLVEFFSAERLGGLYVAWRAEGLWESQPDARDEVCGPTGLIPVVDPLALERDEEPIPEGDRIYWRMLGGTGMGTRFGDYDLDRLLELCSGRSAGYVVFAVPQMIRDARRFRSLLALEAEREEDDLDEEEDEDFDEEEFEGLQDDEDFEDEDLDDEDE
jgi:uncharacterized protein YecE (DUF72 family)